MQIIIFCCAKPL